MRHIVALSGGKDSTAMALRLRELEPNTPFEYVCTPTGNELPEMVDHWRSLGEMLGSPLRPISCGKSLQGLIRDQRCLPNFRMRFCTRIIKIAPFQSFMVGAAPAVCYVGLRADETDRDGVEHNRIEGVVQRYPLQEWGWGYSDVVSYLGGNGVEIPKRTDCAMCFYQTLGEWWALWKDNSDAYREAEKYERWLGHTLRSEQRDSWPASLRDMRIEFERGKIPRGAPVQGELFRGMEDRKSMCSVCAR